MEFTVQTASQKCLVDITAQAGAAAARSGISDGICLVYVPHATAGVIINEFEPNIEADFLALFDRLFPHGNWQHNAIDDNAEAHLKSGVIGPGATIPVENGRLLLGTWQRILLCEFDGPRRRQVVVKVVGK